MQPELFEWSSPAASVGAPSPKPTFLERTSFTLRLDQAIGLALVFLISYVLTFSWGVERGKQAASEVRSANPAAVPTVAVTMPEPPAGPVATVSETTSKEIPVSVSGLPKPVVTAGKPDGKYTIQHVTYLTQSAADREIQRLAKMGHTSFVIPSGRHFQVCIAAFQTRQEAFQFLKQLRVQRTVSWDAYVRPISR